MDRFREFMGPKLLGCTEFEHNPLRKFDIDHLVGMGFYDEFRLDDSAYNHSVGRAIGLGQTSHWKGPFFFWSKAAEEEDKISRVLDFTLADLRLAVDRLLHQEAFPFGVFTTIIAPEAFAVKGVMIHCDGAMAAMNVPRCVPVLVPAGHPIFSSSPPIRVTNIVDLPLLTLRHKTDPSYSSLENIPVTLMHRELTSTNPSWGFTPPAWSGAIGNVLIVHHGRESIKPRQVATIVEFCQNWLEPNFQALRTAGEQALDVLPTPAQIKERKEAILSVFKMKEVNGKLHIALHRPELMKILASRQC